MDWGALSFGLTIGWAAGFVGWGFRAAGYRAVAASAAGVTVWLIQPSGLIAALAGLAAGSVGHELFLWKLREGIQ